MALILTTGSVENAATNPSVNLFVKVLNNNDTQPVQAEITLYSLNGAKNVIGTAVRKCLLCLLTMRYLILLMYCNLKCKSV